MIETRARPPHRDVLLERQLRTLLGDAAPAAISYLRERLQWLEIAAGDVLLEQGAPGDSAYLTISGRLRVYVRDTHGTPRMVRELSRGAVIGEMSLYTGEPRTATVVAVRDSVLVQLDRRDFEGLLAISPQVSITFTRQIIARLQTEHERHALPPPVTVAVLAITDGLQVDQLVGDLAQHLQRNSRVAVIDVQAIDRLLNNPGVAQREDREAAQEIALALDSIEAEHDFVLLRADATASAWTRHCIRHADELLLIADATRQPAVHPIEQQCLAARPGTSEAAETLVLVHPAAVKIPAMTREWLARRPVTAHVHIRAGVGRDLGRLARLIKRTAVGLVFAGGGARGFAHLGVWRALVDHGVEIDCVGGTSIGAILAALVAADPPVDTAVDIARRAFRGNPTGDYNLLPLMSLIKGRRVRGAIDRSIAELVGARIAIEDLWKTYFCIATNYSQASEQPIAKGDLAQALLASVAIPGALPPVVRDGDLLCDGGTFNNFPVDVMRVMRGVGVVIGVDLVARNPRKLAFDQMPGSWALLRDRLRPRQKRRYRLPSLTAYLLNMTILYSLSRQDEARRATDVYFNPPLERVGLLQWSRFDDIVRQGHAHATEKIRSLSETDRARIGATAVLTARDER